MGTRLGKLIAPDHCPPQTFTAGYGGPEGIRQDRRRPLHAAVRHRLLSSARPQALWLRKRKPWKLNVNVFKPFGFTDGSRKLCAVR